MLKNNQKVFKNSLVYRSLLDQWRRVSSGGFIQHYFSIFKGVPKNSAGFTLMELIVVVAIMVMMTASLTINLAGQRASRDIRIAQSQLVSNLRKIQGYTLSARTAPGGQSVQYYAMKFDYSKPGRYTLQAIYDVSSSPKVQDIETVVLPQNINLTALNPIVISRSNAPTTQIPTGCALIVFSAPFAKVFFNSSCTQAAWDASNDDYAKVVNFIRNIDCDVNGNPTTCSVSTDSFMTINLTDVRNTLFKSVTINGITGNITFN